MTDELYDVPVKAMDGEWTTLAPFKGQALLIVNVASRCGFTKQYHELEKLYQQYHAQGFSVLGFPCNQFLKQEPGDEHEIKTFAQSCFNVHFPLFAKVCVRGKEIAPIYQYIANHIEEKPWILTPWNFTKFLINPDGRVLKRFPPTTSFTQLQKEIETILPK